MNSRFLSFLGLACCMAAAVSCTKYEDGPWFTLRTREARVVNSWYYEQALFNGLDIVNGTTDSSIHYYESSLGFDRDGRFSEYVEFKDSTIQSLRYTGSWYFQKRDEELFLEYDNGTYRTFEILRLKEKSLHLKEELPDNNSIEFWLAPTEDKYATEDTGIF